MSLPPALEEQCAAKKAEQLSKIPKDWLIDSPAHDTLSVIDFPSTCTDILNDKEIEITELDDIDELLGRLAKGVWGAEEVTRAYCKRAIIAHQLTNCLTEFWIEDAISQARRLDEIRLEIGPVGPLHGLPVSLKDQFDVAGTENNMGLASWLGRKCKDDAALVTILRKSGAVIFARTNVPMAIMMPETVNQQVHPSKIPNDNVYGRTVNPRNRNLTSGGSSGGEAALLALKGSPLGVGTDLGGSIRNPACLNALYGLKPSTRRMPYWGACNTLVGQESIESSVGPLSRTLSGCATFFKTILQGQPWNLDPKVLEMPWRETMFNLEHLGGNKAKMCFAFMEDDGLVRCQPPVRRAMREAVEAVRQAGHTVIPWNPVDHQHAISILQRTFASDSGEEFKILFGESGEPLLPGIDDVSAFPPITVNAFWRLCTEREAYRKQYLDAWLASASLTSTGRPIDAIICPVAPFPPPTHGNYIYAGYTCVWNVLDLPSVAIPVTVVDQVLDQPEADYKPRNEMDAKVYEMYKSPELFRNGPVGIQVISRRWHEEECLGLARIVDEALKQRKT
ncbi:hypothetical protein PFICI_13072 [Pestalotiopsis fici W106-1]|uniref:amidase n=1 Tax=Pestalotiopsis fici (strain W106-1 / CGMCC3.15140) TaxID=1229662 RepID=W3WL32_PESFW|nr:uncharacterized protein PFICI_13072 [Pestalotiopsis fici W106-1]ETS74588.1 hypothetical protein PFICI_13072 [Pestalotiopsis fici W106-1]